MTPDSPTSTTDTATDKDENGNPRGKRTYKCQRCLNHGQDMARKDHKNNCPWRGCQCANCHMVGSRRELNKKLNAAQAPGVEETVVAATGTRRRSADSGVQMENGAGVVNGTLSDGEESESAGLQAVSLTAPGATNTSQRKPNCQLCAQHGITVALKGHKKYCEYKECACPKVRSKFTKHNLVFSVRSCAIARS